MYIYHLKPKKYHMSYGFFCVCVVHRLFTPANTPKGVDFCVHDPFYSVFGDLTCMLRFVCIEV